MDSKSESRIGDNFHSRQFHRWVGTVAAILFLSVSVTGVVLQYQQLFGEDEARKEALASTVSPQKLDMPLAEAAAMADKARAAVAEKFGSVPVAGVDWQFKGDHPLVVFHLDGKDKLRVAVDARSSSIVKTESDEESWLLRLHTGEIVGDGGKVLGLLWALALVGMTYTGVVMYLQMVRGRTKAGRTGWKRWFWLLVLLPFPALA